MADVDTDVIVPTPGQPRHPPHRRGWARELMIGVLVVVIAVGAGLGVQAWRVSSALGKIKHFSTTVNVGGAGAKSRLVLPAPLLGVVTFLVFTTGSHDMTKADAVKYGVPDVKARGADNMTDTIVLVSVDTRSGDIGYLSIPRDTWVPRYGQKINEIYLTHGVGALVDEVQSITGVPVNHVVGLGFTAFGRLADAVGGVSIRIPVPTRDAESHLLLPSVGCVHMDGRTALAFARSRHTDVYTPAQGWHRDPGASDLQRETRQQVVADAFVHKLLTPSLPLLAPAIADAVANEITTDAKLSIPTLISTGVSLATQGHITTHHFLLPSTFGTAGNASVTFVDPYPAAHVLEAFGRNLPGFSLPRQYPTVPAPTATPSATSSTSTRTTVAPPSPVIPQGVDLTRTALYSVCG